MAFRRLTMAERFSLRGATSWRALLVDPVKFADPNQCRWGFVPQKTLVKAMTKFQDKYRFRVHVDSMKNFVEGPSAVEDFERYSIDVHEFKEGAAHIYEDITTLFCDPSVDFRDVELVSPRLSLFLNDCLVAYEEAGFGTPSIELDTAQDVGGGGGPAVDTVIQDLSVEFGNIDHYGKYFGVYDGQEIRFHLLGGISPEITTANEYMGDGPKRVSASVLYSVREKVWFPEKEDKPEEFSNNVHYFEFESSIRGPINWRLRNINKSIDTP